MNSVLTLFDTFSSLIPALSRQSQAESSLSSYVNFENENVMKELVNVVNCQETHLLDETERIRRPCGSVRVNVEQVYGVFTSCLCSTSVPFWTILSVICRFQRGYGPVREVLTMSVDVRLLSDSVTFRQFLPLLAV